MSVKHLSIQDAIHALNTNYESAFIDVREHGQFGEGHALFAVNLPYSMLEANARRLLPRHSDE